MGQRFEAAVLVRVNLQHAQEIDYRPASLDLERAVYVVLVILCLVVLRAKNRASLLG